MGFMLLIAHPPTRSSAGGGLDREWNRCTAAATLRVSLPLPEGQSQPVAVADSARFRVHRQKRRPGLLAVVGRQGMLPKRVVGSICLLYHAGHRVPLEQGSTKIRGVKVADIDG